MSENWIAACSIGDIEPEDVIRFDHETQTYAIYRDNQDRYFATQGLCTHGKVHLAGGLVMDEVIECPKHNGRFNYETGKALSAPACVDLAIYPVKIENGRVLIRIN